MTAPTGPADTSPFDAVVEASPLAPVADSIELRRAYGCFPSGVAAVCADLPTGPIGMLVSSFTSVSVEPPLVSICIMNTSSTWRALAPAPRLGISFLSHDQQSLCAQLSGPSAGRFDGLAVTVTDTGAVFVPGATAWLDCAVHSAVPAGDHTIVLLQIESLSAQPSAAPLVFHGSRFHRLSA